MTDTALARSGELLGGAFALKLDAFRLLDSLPDGLWLALVVVLGAGLSLAIGQSIVLFINCVKPLRFCLSLLLNAVLFACGYVFLVLSTWLICLLPWSVHVPLLTLLKVLGLAYAPLLFSFLGALPYLGNPLLKVLQVWNLLAMVAGFAAVARVGASYSLGYVAIGWVVKQLLEGTIGQPIARFGRLLAERVAGVDLADNAEELLERVRAGRPASPILAAGQALGQNLPGVRQWLQAAGQSASEVAQTVVQIAAEAGANPAAAIPAHFPGQRQPRGRGLPPAVKLGLSLLAMAIGFALIAVLLRPVRDTVFGWHERLPPLFQFLFDMTWIGLVAIVFAGILAPLETLGWWAGWFGDDLDQSAIAAPITPPENLNRSRSDSPQPGTPEDSEVSRYVIYLDGIGQSGEEYTPDVEAFLAALQPKLPPDVVLLQGLMMYSVLNKPLDKDRPLAFLWKLADRVRWKNPAALLGIILNLRNVLIVAVSADQRYGPIYNQGIAQVMYDGLRRRGYQPHCGAPITLIGYSGGGQMSIAAAPYLKRAIGAPIEVISLGGVMSANNDVLELEQLYHLVGDRDGVERIGPVMFPGRWKIFPLSYWNRAKRRGNISIISMGPVGHQVPGGYMDSHARLPNGKTHQQQTIDTILRILRGDVQAYEPEIPRQQSNYALYKQAAFNQPSSYPLDQTVDASLYRPIGEWMGRLILPKPEQRRQVRGALLEVHHAPPEHSHLIGTVVNLRWQRDPAVQRFVRSVTRDIHYSADAEYGSKYGGLIHPDRLNHWRQVDPLESLAGSHPVDDVVVLLEGLVEVETTAKTASIYIASAPVQITGRYYALIQFIAPIGEERFRVRHFNPASRQFDGPEEVVAVPPVVAAAAYGSCPSTARRIEQLPLNETGWYIYGAKDARGTFVVQAWAPRSLRRLQPGQVRFGQKSCERYLYRESWADAEAQKGTISSVLCVSNPAIRDIQTALAEWQEGDRALLIHTYGGIGGKKKEPAAKTPIFFGHFAYGMVQVVREPLTGELQFDHRYYQVYTHNTDGLIAGVFHWSRYMGDRQFGWAGNRPTCDLLLKLDSFTGSYQMGETQVSPLTLMLDQLQTMTARYRTGDGTGGTYVGPANNCSQDSNQALFFSIQRTQRFLRRNPQVLQPQTAPSPEQAQRFQQLQQLGRELALKLQPFGSLRKDWERNDQNLGSTLEDHPIRNLTFGLVSWRALFPRLASDTIAGLFLKYGASMWVLRTNQIGGDDPDIAPIAPTSMTFFK